MAKQPGKQPRPMSPSEIDLEDPEQGKSNTDLMNQRQLTMEKQDQRIDQLYDSVLRQKKLASDIGEEADSQVALLSTLEEKVDHQGARIRNTTKRVEKLEVESSTKCLWITIACLVLILVVILIVAFSFTN